MRNDRTALEQLEHYLMYQTYWSEHNVSITVYVKDHEWMGVGDWVYRHFDRLAGVSFLPHSEHTYRQAPYTECTPERVRGSLTKMPDFDLDALAEFERMMQPSTPKNLRAVLACVRCCNSSSKECSPPGSFFELFSNPVSRKHHGQHLPFNWMYQLHPFPCGRFLVKSACQSIHEIRLYPHRRKATSMGRNPWLRSTRSITSQLAP